MNRTPDKLPDPWLFDSEKLLRELDRCREMVLLIPPPTHETHFATNIAIDALWNLRENIRYLLHLHREGQREFAKKSLPSQQSVSTPQNRRQPSRNRKQQRHRLNGRQDDRNYAQKSN